MGKAFSGTAKFVQIDEFKDQAGPLQADPEHGQRIGETYIPEEIVIGKERFPVWEGPARFVAPYISMNPSRYKLFESEKMYIAVKAPNFSIEWKYFHPWFPRKKEVPRIDPKTGKHATDPDNDELLFDTVIEWIEDVEGKTVPKGDVPAPKADVAADESKMVALEKAIEELRKANCQLEDKLKFFSDQILQKDNQIKKLKEEIKNQKGA